jgi:ribosomal protein S18 acetylase RimI-like enzyme
MDRPVTFRPIAADDEGFLASVYASTRAEELAPVPWSDAEKAAFCRMQFAVQHRYYQEHYAGSSFDVILVGGEPAGRLYVHRGPDQFRVIDIALLPAYRNAGIGSAILTNLLAEAHAAGLPVTIHVEKMNPALRLYYRLGFREAGDAGVYWFLRREPLKLGTNATHEPNESNEPLDSLNR